MALFQNLLLGEWLLLAEERKTFARMRSVARRLGLRRPTRLIGGDAGIAEVGPHSPVRKATVGLDVEGRELSAVRLGHDQVAGSPAFERVWSKLPPFSSRDIEETQKLLSNKKYYSDTVDGRLGSVTRRAIGQYQKAINMRIDCWPSRALLDQLQRSDKR
jgi:hypothetical protein